MSADLIEWLIRAGLGLFAGYLIGANWTQTMRLKMTVKALENRLHLIEQKPMQLTINVDRERDEEFE